MANPGIESRSSGSKPRVAPSNVTQAESSPNPQQPRSVLWQAVASALLVAAIVAGGLYWRSHRPTILTEHDTVVLADFNNTTGDAVFDDTLKQVISAQLGQSPFLNILSECRTRATLRLMAKPASTKLTPEVCELCQRAEARCTLRARLQMDAVCDRPGCNQLQDGRLSGAGTGNRGKQGACSRSAGRSGDGAAQESRSAASDKFDAPLDQVTTPSLEALKAFVGGKEDPAGEGPRGWIPSVQRAVELDPNFAAAYSAPYSNLREPGLASENLQKAYDLRDKVSEREKFRISAGSPPVVTGELEKAIQTYEIWALDLSAKI